MAQRFEYRVHEYWRVPVTGNVYFDMYFREGWRLVSVVTVSKDNFIAYWEKPYNG